MFNKKLLLLLLPLFLFFAVKSVWAVFSGCTNTSCQSDEECCNSGNCQLIGQCGGTPSCPAGYHYNGSPTPPYCSPDCPPSCTGALCGQPDGCGGTCANTSYSCTAPLCGQSDGCGGTCPSTSVVCNAPLCGQSNGCGGTCANTGSTQWGAWSPSSWCGTVTQTQTNACGGTNTRTSSCTECGPHGSQTCGNWTQTYDCRSPISGCRECGPSISAWSTCSSTTHTRTRTCSENCGTNDCSGVTLSQNCLGEIRGTLFDATTETTCPFSSDPVTGYLIGVDTTLTANNRLFGLTDQDITSPHPWSLLSSPTTDSSGNYNVSVYAPATYIYDFSSLSDIYVVSNGPKVACTSVSAVVLGSPTNCVTQPCSIVNNISFGFDRYWTGWWQVVGASVHAENGLKSSIPSSLPTEQSLILGDGTASNRQGVVSYGTLVNNMLGLNANAKVSANLWQAVSNYEGVIYDYAYFNQQFKKYITTTWDGVGSVVYDDGGRGYEIVKVASGSGVTNLSYNPVGTEKIIFLVDENVTINSNIVVPSGAYLAVIASGDITFGTSVTRADGWYLADNINVRCIDADLDLNCDRTDVQFLGNGSFVGWKGINLSRDRGAAPNTAGPAEKFTYRQDLYQNAPEPMKNVTKRYKPYVP